MVKSLHNQLETIHSCLVCTGVYYDNTTCKPPATLNTYKCIFTKQQLSHDVNTSCWFISYADVCIYMCTPPVPHDGTPPAIAIAWYGSCDARVATCTAWCARCTPRTWARKFTKRHKLVYMYNGTNAYTYTTNTHIYVRTRAQHTHTHTHTRTNTCTHVHSTLWYIIIMIIIEKLQLFVQHITDQD